MVWNIYLQRVFRQYVRGMLTLTPSSVIPKTRNLVDNTKHQVATFVFHAGNNGHLHKEIDLAGSENLRGIKVAASSSVGSRFLPCLVTACVCWLQADFDMW